MKKIEVSETVEIQVSNSRNVIRVFLVNPVYKNIKREVLYITKDFASIVDDCYYDVFYDRDNEIVNTLYDVFNEHFGNKKDFGKIRDKFNKLLKLLLC